MVHCPARWVVELGIRVGAIEEMADRAADVRWNGLAGPVRGIGELDFRAAESRFGPSDLDCSRNRCGRLPCGGRIVDRLHRLHLHPRTRTHGESLYLRVRKSGSSGLFGMASAGREG